MEKRANRIDQFTKFRTVLMTERARLSSDPRSELEVLLAPGSIPMEDQAPVLHEQALALWQHRIDRSNLKLIDAALARLDQKKFGSCEECGEDIPQRRLQVIPWAPYCVPCQEQLDVANDGEPDLQLAA